MNPNTPPEAPSSKARSEHAPVDASAEALSPAEAVAALKQLGLGPQPGGAPEPAAFNAPALIGRTLGQYRIEKQVGQGGMGLVFKAHDTALDRMVALKVLFCGPLDDPKTAERFNREALNLARLSHPNLLHVYNVGSEDSLHYFAMELLAGRTLAMHLYLRKSLPPEECLPWAGQILSALHYVHQQGITHRDIKSGNIMLCGERAVLMDFGLAKDEQVSGLTSAGTVLGTPEYMAPEQAEGQSHGPPTDLYSFGVLLYEALSGALPFTGRSAFSILQQHLSAPPPALAAKAPQLDPRLGRVIERCLAKQSQDRFPSCVELAAALLPIFPTAELAQLAAKGGTRSAMTATRMVSGAAGGAGAASPGGLAETLPAFPGLPRKGGTAKLEEPAGAPRTPAWIWASAGFVGMLALGLGLWAVRRPSKAAPGGAPVRLEGVPPEAGKDLRIVLFERPNGTEDLSKWVWVLEWQTPGGERRRETITGYQEFWKRVTLKEVPAR